MDHTRILYLSLKRQNIIAIKAVALFLDFSNHDTHLPSIIGSLKLQI